MSFGQKGRAMAGDSEHELKKLVGLAAEVNYVEAVHALPGGSSFAAYVQRISADYWARHDDDSGYGAWMQERWAGAQRAWAADVAIVTGVPQQPRVEVPDASAILEAAAAWERDGADLPPRHYATLVQAVINRRGPFAMFLSREMAACPRDENVNEHMALRRDEMRKLFRRDLAAVIKEAEGG
jgi:hypothetical protein